MSNTKTSSKSSESGIQKTKTFLKKANRELKRVEWPDKPKVVETTLIVGGCTVIFALYLWLVDLGIAQLFSTIF